jgi:hypothetical protein
VRFDNNRYSVSASAVGRPVEVQAYAERVFDTEAWCAWNPSKRPR